MTFQEADEKVKVIGVYFDIFPFHITQNFPYSVANWI